MLLTRLGNKVLLAAVLLLWPFSLTAAEPGPGFTLGVIPSAPPVATHTLWSPMVERLARETGLPFRLKVYEKMADFERDIVSPAAPDFIFANSLQIVVAHQAQGYVPLVRGSGTVWVELFVRGDSSYKAVDDLAGRKIAFVGSKNL
ncbi:MAG: phosphate/phosphite/phosphonate ABC transporter substrate-binding protein [Desulfobulbaceae bacterium]|nr:phosphate/phosphite/phosphonate ABC transporter substrate-binding protein [Desulfobulbaceae bacterium]